MNDIVLIIGASSDIGLNLIESFKETSTILAHYNSNDQKLQELASNTHHKLVPLKADLSKEEDITSLLEEVISNHGVPNKIIHLAAGKFSNMRFKELKWQDGENDIAISLQ